MAELIVMKSDGGVETKICQQIQFFVTRQTATLCEGLHAFLCTEELLCHVYIS